MIVFGEGYGGNGLKWGGGVVEEGIGKWVDWDGGGGGGN